MILRELEGDKCPWEYRGQPANEGVVSFALCHDCPMLVSLIMYGESSDSKTHTVAVNCKKEGSK